MLRRAIAVGATIVGAAAVLRAVFDPWYLNYDARYALLWSRDVWTGHLPEYEADFAPTPKPLQALISSLTLPFGDASDDLLTFGTIVALGVLAFLTYRLAEELFGNRWVGAVAAAVVFTRPVMLRDTFLAYQDVPFAALIVGATLVEAKRPRAGVPVLVLLAIAGLLRPEAWVLAGLYWLYLFRAGDRRIALVLLVAAAPVIWALTDLIVTGDPLHSLHGTAELAEENERRRSITQVPRWGAQYVAYTLREPLILGVPAGLVFAYLYKRREATLPVAVAAAMLLVFAIGPIFGLPLIGRYVRTPAVLLTLFYGLAVFGWMLLPKGSNARRNWTIVGVVAGLASVAFLPKHVEMLRGLETRFERDGRLYADLREAGNADVVRAAFARCKPLSTADHRPIPYIRWWLEGDPGTVTTIRKRTSPLGKLLLVPRDVRSVRRFYKTNFPRRTARRPPGWTELYRNRSWKIYAAPGCGRAMSS